jgi:hypothetical protein
MKNEKIVLGLIVLVFMNSCGSTIGPIVTNINSGVNNNLLVQRCYITYNNFWLLPILSDIKITNCDSKSINYPISHQNNDAAKENSEGWRPRDSMYNNQ